VRYYNRFLQETFDALVNKTVESVVYSLVRRADMHLAAMLKLPLGSLVEVFRVSGLDNMILSFCRLEIHRTMSNKYVGYYR
jgi:hypothetical protein